MFERTFFRRVAYVPYQLREFLIRSDNDATVHYYGKSTFRNLPLSDDEMEEHGFVVADEERMDMEYEDDALYNAEMRHTL